MVEILITGGTIAKTYDAISGGFVFDKDHLTKMISQAHITKQLSSKLLFLKDSLDMDDCDRAIIKEEILSSTSKNILVLHGTDTMVKSAKYIGEVGDKRVVFTGAMIPYALKNSDALFNFGFALGVVERLESGVYIAMNAKVFKRDRVQKDRGEGVFIESRCQFAADE